MRLPKTLIVVLTLCCGLLTQTRSLAEPMPTLEHFSPAMADKDLDPCADFFQYSCGKWLKANPIPSDQPSWGTFNSLALWNIAAVRETLEQAATSTGNRTTVQQQVGDYYASCVDEAGINRAGLAPLQPMLERIAKFNDKAALPELIAYIQQRIRPANLNFIEAQYQGVLFGIYSQPGFDDASVTLPALDQAGMNLPAREFYLKDDAKSTEIRGQYVQHVTRMLELSGESHAKAAADAQSVLAIETALANAAMDIVLRRDPKNQNNKMTPEQVQALTPAFNWKRYFAAMRAPSSSQYLVIAPDFFRGLDKLIASESLDHWRAYLRYSALHDAAPFLSRAFVEENFAFYGRTLNGAQTMQPRARRCSFSADIDLGDAVGQAYVARYFPPENKARMLEMVKAIKSALQADIESSNWMSPKTKKLALEKLAAQVDKIGYPNRWLDYSSVAIKRDDYLGNVQHASAFEINRRLSKFGRPSDRQEWNMTPPTVNAYEDPTSNTINFPAGILQPPFFEVAQIDAVNFGAIGAVIGHEIIHGYDDQGRKFDAQGNLRDWWTPEDGANYDKRDECITDEYTQDVPEAGVKQNGKLSAGEDTADNGGVHIALNGLEGRLKAEGRDLDSMTKDGLTELQTFFLSYAHVWCGQLRPEAARTAVLSQGHSLGRYRVNNVLENMPEFAHAFGCKAGQSMVHANACRVW
ncbi:MAG: M13 family metallopeptidase [Acidobacteria bacterium]|nr:M13 family metallopeptidase [Acidobacteriota bacterium]